MFVSDQFTHIKGFRQPNKPLPATRATVVVAPQKGENNLAEAFACTLEKPRGSSYCGSQLFFFSCPQLGFLSAWEEGGSSRSYRCRQPKIKYISRAVSEEGAMIRVSCTQSNKALIYCIFRAFAGGKRTSFIHSLTLCKYDYSSCSPTSFTMASDAAVHSTIPLAVW